MLPDTKDVFDFAKVHDGTLAYCTVRHIGKQLLLLAPQDEIRIERLQHTDRDGTSGMSLCMTIQSQNREYTTWQA